MTPSCRLFFSAVHTDLQTLPFGDRFLPQLTADGGPSTPGYAGAPPLSWAGTCNRLNDTGSQQALDDMPQDVLVFHDA